MSLCVSPGLHGTSSLHAIAASQEADKKQRCQAQTSYHVTILKFGQILAQPTIFRKVTSSPDTTKQTLISMFANLIERRVALLRSSQRVSQPYARSISFGFPKLGESSSSSSSTTTAGSGEEQYDPTFQVDFLADLKGDHTAKRGDLSDAEDRPSGIEGILEPESFGVSRPR